MLAQLCPRGMSKGMNWSPVSDQELSQVLAVSSLCLDSKDKAKRASASSTGTVEHLVQRLGLCPLRKPGELDLETRHRAKGIADEWH
jgi:hypothetical protein